MNKLDQLFIRACKCSGPYARLLSVYSRFYCANKNDPYPALASILLRICKEHVPIDPEKLVEELAPKPYFAEPVSLYKSVVIATMNHIRFSEATKFVGLTAPARFRK